MAMSANRDWLDQFEDENAAGGHPGGVEALPHPAVSPSMTSRRFPPPWTVIENAESFWVKDAAGQTVGWFYFRADPLVAKMAGVLTKDEARRMAVNFARLPQLLGKGDGDA